MEGQYLTPKPPAVNDFFFVLLLLIAALTIPACGEDDGDGIQNADCSFVTFSQRVDPLLADYQDALSAYTVDPSPANCRALAADFEEYRDILLSYEDCPQFADDAQIQADFAALREQGSFVDELECE